MKIFWLSALLSALVSSMHSALADGGVEWHQHRTDTGCIVNLSYKSIFESSFSWRGECEAGKGITGRGQLTHKPKFGNCSIFSGEMINGYWIGSVLRNAYDSSCTSYVYDARNFNFPRPEDSKLITNAPVPAPPQNPVAKNNAPLTSRSGVSKSVDATEGTNSDEGTTGGSVGQNRGKGGNPDYLYDDVDHGKCVSIEPIGATGSQMAYGRYKMINSCAYPLKLIMCITSDRSDGTPSPNFDKHQEGNKCPGMGKGGTTLEANEVAQRREWFEYSNIKWDLMVCKEGWDFIGEDGRFPSDIIGVKYSCRQRRK